MQQNELQHHGVKGQKWGVRRYQNLDGTLTAAGKKRLAKNISKHFDNDTKSDSTIRLAKNNANIQKAINTERLKSARTKLDEFGKLAKEYDDNDDIIYEYKVKAYAQWSGKSEEMIRSQFSKNSTSFMYDDWDQGNLNSFDLFLRDRGTNQEEFAVNVQNVLDDYRKECRSVTESMLGKYGNTHVNRQYSWEGHTATEAMVDSMVDAVDDELHLHLRYM